MISLPSFFQNFQIWIVQDYQFLHSMCCLLHHKWYTFLSVLKMYTLSCLVLNTEQRPSILFLLRTAICILHYIILCKECWTISLSFGHWHFIVSLDLLVLVALEPSVPVVVYTCMHMHTHTHSKRKSEKSDQQLVHFLRVIQSFKEKWNKISGNIY